MRLRLPVLPVLALAASAGLAGCGSDDEASGLADLAKPGTVVFAEGTIRPSGDLKSDADAAAKAIGGIDNLGDFVVEKLEEEARGEGEPFDFEAEVEPWLGERAAAAFERVEGDGDLSDPLIVIESTDTEASQEFIDKQAESGDTTYRDASYEGVDFKVDDEDTAVGLIGDRLVVAEGEGAFKAAVDASEGESLADDDRFDSTFSEASEGSLADVYVDLGRVLRQSGDEIDPQALSLLGQAGGDFNPDQAALVASVIPGEDRIELEVRGELGGGEAPGGDVSELLGSLPARSFAAFAVSGFGEQLREGIDDLDESGIPGQVPPGALKGQLKALGIDLEKLAGSLQDAAVFAEGRNEAGLGGALVLTTDDPDRARAAINSLGKLLRSTGTAGVRAVSGKASGFSIRDQEELGDKPVVVVARGERVAIGYGLPATLRGIAGSGPTLADTAAYKESVEALGDTPIDAFVAGPAALRLADSLIPASDEDFEEAKPYLRGIGSIGIGADSEGDLATARLVVNLR